MSYKRKVVAQREACQAATLKDRVRRLQASAAGLLAPKPVETIPIEWGVAGYVCSACQQPLFDRLGMVVKGSACGDTVGVQPHTPATCSGLALSARSS